MQLARNVSLRLPIVQLLRHLGQPELRQAKLRHPSRRHPSPAQLGSERINHVRFSKSEWCGYAGYANAKSSGSCYGDAAGSYAHADSADIWRTGQHNAERLHYGQQFV